MATLKEDMAHFTTLASIKTPRVMRAVFLILLAAIVIVIAFLIYVPWVQTTSGRGVVTTLSPNERKQDINALVPGRIEELLAQIARDEAALSDPALYSKDPAKFAALTKAIEAARAEKDAAEERWLELAELVEG